MKFTIQEVSRFPLSAITGWVEAEREEDAAAKIGLTQKRYLNYFTRHCYTNVSINQSFFLVPEPKLEECASPQDFISLLRRD